MESVISELWNGEIAPCEHCGAQDRKANTLFAKVRQGREALAGELTESQRAHLEACVSDWEDYLLRMMELAFREGMVLGLRLGAETFSRRP